MPRGIRIDLISYTASFRVPWSVGHQLTLSVPPLSTIYGIISSAAGRLVQPSEIEWLAFRFSHKGITSDLEAIVTFDRAQIISTPSPKTRNVIEREFLFYPRLTLYLPPVWQTFFDRPRRALLLGRTQDLAAVDHISEVELEEISEGEVEGVLLPREIVFSQQGVPCSIYSLPIAFTEDPNRHPLGVAIFGVVARPFFIKAPGWLVKDNERNWTIPIYRWEWIGDVIGRTAGQVV